MNNKNYTNYNFINIIKFIFSIFVIAAHTKTSRLFCDNPIKEMIIFFMSSSVPFFFICMGYSIAEKINFYNYKKRSLMITKTVLKDLIKLYIIWNIIYLPLALIEYFDSGNSFIYCFFSYLKGFFLKGEHYNSWQLWYLLSFIYSLGFIYICMKKNISFKKTFVYSLLLGSLSIIIKVSNIYEINCSLAIIKHLLKIIELTIDNGRIFTAFLYVPLGIIFQRYAIDSRYCLIGILFSFILLAYCGVFGQVFGKIIFSCSMFAISIKIKISSKFNRLCNLLRDLSTSNYYTHMLAFSLYYAIVYGEPTYTIDCFIYTTIITLAFGMIGILFKHFKAKKFDITKYTS